jgi:chromosome partitioning protein
MKVLGIIAQKGGSGKTTLSVHLAVRATLEGLKVLLVDIDPQASTTGWWRRRETEAPDLIQADGKRLASVLGKARSKGYQLVIVDTAPHSSADATACARQADRVLIPTRPAILDLDAIGTTTELVASVGVAAEVVLNACPPATKFGETKIVCEAREAVKAYGIPVSDAAISQRAAFSHALIDGHAVNEFDPHGKAAAEIERLWMQLSKELI